MATAGDFYDAINDFAPFGIAEKWDNVGLLIGGRELPVTRALLALDLTGAVLEEAVLKKAKLVVTHHPVIFKRLKALDARGIPYRTAAAGISVISAHTNLDMADGGVNDVLAACIGLRNVRGFSRAASDPYRTVSVFVPVINVQEVYLAMAGAGAGMDGNYSHCGFFARGEGRFLPLEGSRPAIGEIGRIERVEEIRLEMLCAPDRVEAVVAAMKAAHPYEQPAYSVFENHAARQVVCHSRIGELERPLAPVELATRVRACIGAAGLRYTDGGEPISTVAVAGGSGGDFLFEAKERGAQALVTGEIKHHLILAAGELGMTVVDGGHFATENIVLHPLLEELRKRVPDVEIELAESCTDGMRYLA